LASETSVLARREPVNRFAAWLYEVAEKWQRRWRSDRVFEANPDPSKPKFFITAAFPYPNSPLHLGHSRTYTIADVHARFKRMLGYNVLFPMGFHYTGTPILTMAEAIAAGDEELIDLMLNVYDVPASELDRLKDPLSLARFFHEDAKKAMNAMGYSIDWRREFTTIDPEFQKFIVWQYTKLREKGLITKGTHPVGWCPKHNMPVGMHDTKNDVEPEIEEFTLILFRHGEEFFPAATLRPETVFGVTNLWVNPDATYVRVRVDGRVYVVSKEAAWKLSFQKDSVNVVGEVKGRELVGIRVVNPATGREVPVLPASFVDPSTATGVVMSVPAHAPYDYVALKEMVESQRELLESIGVSVDSLKPIPLIRVRGYGSIPAKDIVERMGISSQAERLKLDEATRTLYSDEYHEGVMRDDIVSLVYPDAPSETRVFIKAPVEAWIRGASVRDAREATRKWLSALGFTDVMYEISNKPVYCRCGTEIVVKVLKDQWFINYGDREWKKTVLELIDNMAIVPHEMREEFLKTVDWLHERAVARTRGLGTELPWARGWRIESLSDSTIYMAFYTIVHKLKRYGIKPEKLGVEFWDYVLHGRGDVDKLSSSTGLDRKIIEDLREEFNYWYPLDARHSGRDLVPNHLTFFIFHHAALFPKDKWPRQIVVNGFVRLEGKKMSKSLRNIIPLRRAVKVYGPDTIRAALLASAELLQDADFSDNLAMSVLSQLAKLLRYLKLVEKADGESGLADRWLLSRLQDHISNVTKYMSELRTRHATITLLYDMDNDVVKYLAIRERPGPALREYLEKWVLMLSPITPHIAEEIWHMLGHDTYVSLEHWPVPDQTKIDRRVELAVEYAERLIEDIRAVLRVVKTKPTRAIILVTRPEKWPLAQQAAAVIKKGGQVRDIVRALLGKVADKDSAKSIVKMVEYMRQQSMSYLELVSTVSEFDEKKAIEDLGSYIAKKTSIPSIEVYYADEAPPQVPASKVKAAIPGRPSITVL